METTPVAFLAGDVGANSRTTPASNVASASAAQHGGVVASVVEVVSGTEEVQLALSPEHSNQSNEVGGGSPSTGSNTVAITVLNDNVDGSDVTDLSGATTGDEKSSSTARLVSAAAAAGGTLTVAVASGAAGTALVTSPQFIMADGVSTRSYTSLTPVHPGQGHGAVAVVTGSEALGPDALSHSTYVQYVDSSPDSALYAATNGQMAYPAYTVVDSSGGMYSPGTGQYYSGTNVTYTQVGGVVTQGNGGQILAQGGGTYLIQQGIDPDGHPLISTTRASPQTDGNVTYLVNAGNGNGNNGGGAGGASNGSNGNHGNGNGGGVSVGSESHYSLAHATRVSPATVQWLIENYETAEGVSLPRSTLYNHYLRHCSEHKLEPVNAASFGKLIRSVFLGLRTRRLGTRGNSKYHYYGIRIKPTSSLASYVEEGSSGSGPQGSSTSNKRSKTSPGHRNSVDGSGEGHNSSSHSESTSPQHQQYLGDAAGALPNFPELEVDMSHLPPNITEEDLNVFANLYRDQCEAILDAVISLQFNTVETAWRHFWRNSNNNDLDMGLEEDPEKLLPKSKLYDLCRCDGILQFVRKADYQFYQNLVEVLIPDVLRPIPGSLTQAIRNFAKGLEGWLLSAMNGCPEEVVLVKAAAVNAFSQTLRRYTSLNHLAQAARAVLHNSNQISQMLDDLNRVDFHNVQEQASWVCQCDDELVSFLEADFKATLQSQASLEQWATWLEGVVNKALLPYQGRPDFARAARQFLLKWSFYSSMVIRDLTLRSAASFGSFHLIRLLYDEYMFFLVEHRVAAATGETPIAVMGEFIGTSQTLRCHGDSTSPHSNAEDSPSFRETLGTMAAQVGTRSLPESAAHPLVKRARLDS